MHLKGFCFRCWEWAEKFVIRALSAKEIGYLKDHCIESATENWRYFSFSPNGGRSRRNVYLLNIEVKSFRDGIQDICEDTESNVGPFAGL